MFTKHFKKKLWVFALNITQEPKLLYITLVPDLGTCSFICQDTSTRSSEVTFFVFRVKLPPVTTSLTTQKVETIPLSAFAQGHNKRICRPISTISLISAERQAGKL